MSEVQKQDKVENQPQNPLPLSKPLETDDGQKLDKLKFNDLPISVIEDNYMEPNKQTKSINFVAASCGLKADDVRKLSVRDFNKASDIVMGFME